MHDGTVCRRRGTTRSPVKTLGHASRRATLRSPLVPFGIPLSLVRSPAEPAYGGLSHTRIEYHALPNKPFIALKNLKNPI